MSYNYRTRTLKNGNTSYYILKNFWNPETKKPAQKQICSFSREQLLSEHKDPDAFIQEYLRKLENDDQDGGLETYAIDYGLSLRVPQPSADAHQGSQLHTTENLKNLGYAALSRIYHELELDEFVNNRRRSIGCDYNLNTLMQHILYSRCIFPCSKQSLGQRKDRFFGDTDYETVDLYRAMDYFLPWRKELLTHLNAMAEKKFDRKSLLFYYDVTNYYFEIDRQDALRAKGVSKEHRPEPIIQMGLFMDSNGLPVSYEIFRGNTSDTLTLEPAMDDGVIDFRGATRVVVADKGMMSADNITKIRLEKNGYVISQSVRKSDEATKAWVLETGGFEDTMDGKTGEITYRIKERYTPKQVFVCKRDENDHSRQEGKSSSSFNERQVCIYSAVYAARAKKERGEAVAKALEAVGSRSKNAKDSNYGSLKYLKKIPKKKKDKADVDSYDMVFDEKALAEDEKYDGYYLVCTNLIGTKNGDTKRKVTTKYTNDGYLRLSVPVPASKIMEIYGGLWKIEETFKVTKTGCLNLRPVLHWSENRIRAHFLLTFISLILTRFLEYRLGWKYSAKRIMTSLSRCNGSLLPNSNVYMFNYYDEVLDEIGKTMHLDFSKVFKKSSDIRTLLARTKIH
jgi:transposase